MIKFCSHVTPHRSRLPRHTGGLVEYNGDLWSVDGTPGNQSLQRRTVAQRRSGFCHHLLYTLGLARPGNNMQPRNMMPNARRMHQTSRLHLRRSDRWVRWTSSTYNLWQHDPQQWASRVPLPILESTRTLARLMELSGPLSCCCYSNPGLEVSPRPPRNDPQ